MEKCFSWFLLSEGFYKCLLTWIPFSIEYSFVFENSDLHQNANFMQMNFNMNARGIFG